MLALAHATLPRLTPAQREILEMRYLRQASIEDLVLWLGVSKRNVLRRLNNAHLRLGIRPLRKRRTHKRTIIASQFVDRRVQMESL